MLRSLHTQPASILVPYWQMSLLTTKLWGGLVRESAGISPALLATTAGLRSLTDLSQLRLPVEVGHKVCTISVLREASIFELMLHLEGRCGVPRAYRHLVARGWVATFVNNQGIVDIFERDALLFADSMLCQPWSHPAHRISCVRTLNALRDQIPFSRCTARITLLLKCTSTPLAHRMTYVQT